MFSLYSLDITRFSGFCHLPPEVNEGKPAYTSIVGTTEADPNGPSILLAKM
ncbi:MAG: hypothetical protein ACRC8Y_18165 [Chroococcales cyanobacterium]